MADLPSMHDRIRLLESVVAALLQSFRPAGREQTEIEKRLRSTEVLDALSFDPLQPPSGIVNNIIHELVSAFKTNVTEKQIADFKERSSDFLSTLDTIRNAQDIAKYMTDRLGDAISELERQHLADRREFQSFLATLSFSQTTETVTFQRYVPVAIYSPHTPPDKDGPLFRELRNALRDMGIELVDEAPAVRRSWLKRAMGRFVSPVSQEQMEAALADIRKALEIKHIDKPIAEINEKKITALSSLATSFKGEDNVDLLVGNILFQKRTDNAGKSHVKVVELSADQVAQEVSRAIGGPERSDWAPSVSANILSGGTALVSRSDC